MLREGDDIYFETIDHERCEGLPPSIPVDDLPGLFEDIAAKMVRVVAEIPYAGSTWQKGDISARGKHLHMMLGEMLDLAGDEILEAQLTG